MSSTDYDVFLSPNGTQNTTLIVDGTQGNVFEFSDVGVQLTEDPSFSLAVVDQLETDVSAVALSNQTLSATTLNTGFVKIITDSTDLTDYTATDISFQLDPQYFFSAFSDGGNGVGAGTNSNPNIVFSDADVKKGGINSFFTSQKIKEDVVRNIAYQITGGYAAADIFDNEAALVADVVNVDNGNGSGVDDLNAQVTAAIDATAYTNQFKADNASDLVHTAVNNLLAINLGDTDGRLNDLMSDLSGNADGSSTNEGILRFKGGDMITMKVTYTPATATPTNAGTIDPRSYRIIFKVA